MKYRLKAEDEMNLTQIQKLFKNTVHWDAPKRGKILVRSARSCFNARCFSDRLNVDFSRSYDKIVRSDEREGRCGIKGTYEYKNPVR